MYCDGCDKEPVIHEVIKDPVTGELVEHHYCADCPAANGQGGGPVPTLSNVVAQSITLGESDVHRDAPESAECPTCGLSYREFRRSGLLGCGACYETFEARLGPLVSRAHDGATHHVGKVPKRALLAATDRADDAALLGSTYERAQRLSALRRQIDEAVRGEQYERAATLRDELRALQRRDDSSEIDDA